MRERTSEEAARLIKVAMRNAGQCNLFEVMHYFCELATAEKLTEQEFRNERHLWEFSQIDSDLEYWMERAEYYVDYEATTYNSEPVFDFVFSHLLLDRLICRIQNEVANLKSANDLKNIVSKFRFEPKFLEREIKYKKGKNIARSIILEQPPLSIYLTGWLPGQKRDFHSHQAPDGPVFDVIKVYKGELTHEFWDESKNPDKPLVKDESNVFKEDTLIAIDNGRKHRLGNLSSEMLVTLTFRVNLSLRVQDAQVIPLPSKFRLLPHPLLSQSEIKTFCSRGENLCRRFSDESSESSLTHTS